MTGRTYLPAPRTSSDFLRKIVTYFVPDRRMRLELSTRRQNVVRMLTTTDEGLNQS